MGDLPLHRNECYGELDADEKLLKLAFSSLVDTYFPKAATAKATIEQSDKEPILDLTSCI